MGLCNLDLDPVWVSITMWSFKYLIKYIPLSARSQPLQRYLVIVQFLVQWGLRPAAVFRQTLETCSAWWFFFFSVYFYTVMITEGSHFSSFIGEKKKSKNGVLYLPLTYCGQHLMSEIVTRHSEYLVWARCPLKTLPWFAWGSQIVFPILRSRKKTDWNLI